MDEIYEIAYDLFLDVMLNDKTINDTNCTKDVLREMVSFDEFTESVLHYDSGKIIMEYSKIILRRKKLDNINKYYQDNV